MIEAATAAYSPQNAQGWRFLAHGDRLYARLDPDRLFPVVDPANRGGWVSLGAAVENARLAAGAAGYGAVVAFDAAAEWPAAVQLSRAHYLERSDPALAAQIPLRRTHRARMVGPPLTPDDLVAASRAALPGARVATTSARDRVRVLDAVEFAVKVQVGNRDARRDLHRWHRFWPWQAAKAEDGILASNLGMSRVRGGVGMILTLPPFVSTFGVPARLGREARRVTDTSTDFLVFVSPTADPAGLFEGGRGWQRAALALSARGVVTHAMTAPVDVPDAAAALRRIHGIAEVEGLVAFVRAGRPDSVLPAPPRRAPEEFVDRMGP